MGSDSRLNILLTHVAPDGRDHPGRPRCATDEPQPWYQMISHLLLPLGVRTFEATTGPAAMDLIEHEPIHLAVLDTRLGEDAGLNLLRLIQKLRERSEASQYKNTPAGPADQTGHRVEVKFASQPPAERVEVRFEPPAEPKPAMPLAHPVSPVVILVTSPREDLGLLQAAMKFNAFSVVNEPVDVNLMLEMMARALRRFHQNQWPQ